MERAEGEARGSLRVTLRTGNGAPAPPAHAAERPRAPYSPLSAGDEVAGDAAGATTKPPAAAAKGKGKLSPPLTTCCDICVETVAVSALLRCAHCGHACCGMCAKRYFEESPGNPASCMGCRKVLSADNLREAFSEAYVTTGMETARRAALVRQDDAYTLPTQLYIFPLVHRYEALCEQFHTARSAAERLEREHYSLVEQLYELRTARAARLPGAADAVRAREERALYARWRTAGAAAKRAVAAFLAVKDEVLQAHRAVLRADINGIAAVAPRAGAAQPQAAARPERLFRCTSDGCQGNYRAGDGACMVCRVQHCVRCARPTLPGAPHACDAGDVATVRTIATTTRDCPRCHVGITRSSGCAQMMCVACHCIFNWVTGAEERGVIHNPHFHSLGVEERQRILDEREARGIASTREQRFLAGAGARRPLPQCNPHNEMDPECEDFNSAAFSGALDAAMVDAEATRQLREAYREILHQREDVGPSLRRQHAYEVERTELDARRTRVAQLRGAPLDEPEHIKNGHPLGFKSLAWVLPCRREAPPPGAHAATLMRMDTKRTKLASMLEVSETFVEAGTGITRLLLGATPEERPAVLAALLRLTAETKRLMKELQGGKSAAVKRRAAARGGGGARKAARARADSESEEEAEDTDEDEDADDDE